MTELTRFYKFHIFCAFYAVSIINYLFYSTLWSSRSCKLTFLKFLGASTPYNYTRILLIMFGFFNNPYFVNESITHNFYYSCPTIELPPSHIIIPYVFLVSLKNLVSLPNYFLYTLNSLFLMS